MPPSGIIPNSSALSNPGTMGTGGGASNAPAPTYTSKTLATLLKQGVQTFEEVTNICRALPNRRSATAYAARRAGRGPFWSRPPGSLAFPPAKKKIKPAPSPVTKGAVFRSYKLWPEAEQGACWSHEAGALPTPIAF
jgi:hypothetical protein